MEYAIGISVVFPRGRAAMRVGLFLQNLDEEYQINVFRGIRDRARLQGIDLVCVQGEVVGPNSRLIPPFALAHQIRFDGLLVLSSVVIDGGAGQTALVIPSLLPPVPAVSIGIPIRGMVSLTVRYGQAMRQLVTHLVQVHGYRRFLYVGGPVSHPDNQMREADFVQTLREYQEEQPEISWVIDHGGFFEVSGMAVIRRHLDGPPFDVVMAANDNMALGIQRVLSAHPDPGWRRCAVTGYDDISQALVSDPPLTTVHTPIETLGAKALDTLMELLSGHHRPRNRSVATRVVIRRSCGCASPNAGVDPDRLADRLDQVRRQVLESDQWLREGNDFGREMGACKDQSSLVDDLDRFLSVLRVGHLFLVIDGILWYERVGGARTPLPAEGVPIDHESLFSTRTTAVPRPWAFCVYPLRAEDRPLGMVVYSVDDNRLPHLTAALPHVGNAIHRIRTQSEQETRNRVLAEMVAARTAELTEANRSLREEVVRRRTAEEEVLQVSEFERQRFGFDLHDDICQRLAGVAMYIRSVSTQPPQDIRPVLADLGSLVDETLFLTRRYAHASFPIDLETRGLDSVLRSLCETVARQKGIPCDYVCDRRLSRALLGGNPALHLFRIVQEALQNATRHAKASHLSVSLSWEAGQVCLRVTDNGSGIFQHRSGVEGYGLRSMAYRASELGARLELNSEPGRGTVVQVIVPGKVLVELNS